MSKEFSLPPQIDLLGLQNLNHPSQATNFTPLSLGVPASTGTDGTFPADWDHVAVAGGGPDEGGRFVFFCKVGLLLSMVLFPLTPWTAKIAENEGGWLVLFAGLHLYYVF